MNAFFYDYDDFDHTTTLVDWFETDLRHSTNSTDKASVGWGNFQQQTVIGNRQSDKTHCFCKKECHSHNKKTSDPVEFRQQSQETTDYSE
ncbi:unnamed protein product [Candidula unifasciata]|uniref:Uncharacterized protein n=1 Tax=Candidula unifasciata TaxID=100452 RepID=A0A8S3ZNB1_9EUPU|nr:unnamed protein product [Candidula unifasciata]